MRGISVIYFHTNSSLHFITVLLKRLKSTDFTDKCHQCHAHCCGNTIKKTCAHTQTKSTTKAVGASLCCHHYSGGGGHVKWDWALASSCSHENISYPNL